MPRVHSHYENLRVARNAPPEVIRAAYRALSQRYHPDLNPGNAEAARIMAILNVAYHTLSDPVLRADHDSWLHSQHESADAESARPEHAPPPRRSETENRRQVEEPDVAPTVRPAWETRLPFEVVGLAKHLHRRWGWYVTAAIAGVFFYGNQSHTPPISAPAPTVASYQSPRPPPPPPYVRPPVAPNGNVWPASASYIADYPKLNSGGNGEVTVDNTQSESDVFVKLMSLSAGRPKAVRYFYIPGGQSFTTKRIRPGQYDVRYQVLSSGARLKTEAFALTEEETEDGIRYKSMRMTLYKVRDGNMQTTFISEDEFE